MKSYILFGVLLSVSVVTACSGPGDADDGFVDEGNVSCNQESLCPPGEVGPVGPAGEVGPAGPQGLNGAQGSVGPKGDTGNLGSTGPMGLTGATGMTGPAGAQGPQGVQGPTGAQGSQGPQGARGEPGQGGLFDPSALYINSASAPALNNQATSTKVRVACDDGDIMITGNCLAIPTGSLRTMGMAIPGDQPEAWVCEWTHPQSVGFRGYANIRCLDITP